MDDSVTPQTTKNVGKNAYKCIQIPEISSQVVVCLTNTMAT